MMFKVVLDACETVYLRETCRDISHAHCCVGGSSDCFLLLVQYMTLSLQI